MSNLPIGVFDSGLGGISVLATLKHELPNENFIYYADAAYAPYGIKSPEQVLERCRTIIDLFIEQNAKMIIIACNTATSVAVKKLRQEYDIPIIGMEPAVKPAILHTNKEILVLATNMTVREAKLNNLIERLSPTQEIITLGCSKFVDVVEAGHFDDDLSDGTVKECLGNINRNEIGAIVLGCTHFIFLKNSIHRIVGNIPLFDGNLGTAKQAKNILRRKKILSKEKNGKVVIITSSNEEYLMEAKELFKSYYNYMCEEVWK